MHETQFDLHCEKCGYSLRGHDGGRCPECGLNIDHARLREIAARSRFAVARAAYVAQMKLGLIGGIGIMLGMPILATVSPGSVAGTVRVVAAGLALGVGLALWVAVVAIWRAAQQLLLIERVRGAKPDIWFTTQLAIGALLAFVLTLGATAILVMSVFFVATMVAN